MFTFPIGRALCERSIVEEASENIKNSSSRHATCYIRLKDEASSTIRAQFATQTLTQPADGGEEGWGAPLSLVMEASSWLFTRLMHQKWRYRFLQPRTPLCLPVAADIQQNSAYRSGKLIWFKKKPRKLPPSSRPLKHKQILMTGSEQISKSRLITSRNHFSSCAHEDSNASRCVRDGTQTAGGYLNILSVPTTFDFDMVEYSATGALRLWICARRAVGKKKTLWKVGTWRVSVCDFKAAFLPSFTNNPLENLRPICKSAVPPLVFNEELSVSRCFPTCLLPSPPRPPPTSSAAADVFVAMNA